MEHTNCNGFSSARTWAALRPRAALVNWVDIVWFKGNTPKHAFNMWIANLDRLPTKSRLERWGMQIITTCRLCGLHFETRDHLFLNCDFAVYIWNAVCRRLDLPSITFGSWQQLLSWMKRKSERSPPTLRKLITHSVVYAIWRQRNNLHHNQLQVLLSVVFRDIDREIKNSITARRFNKCFRMLMQLWLH